MRVLLFNLATDADDSILGFTTRWIQSLARQVEFIHVVTMQSGRVAVPGNVRVYSLGKEKGWSEVRRAAAFYRYLFDILHQDTIDICFSHMIPLFTIMAGPVLRAKRIPIVTWYAHRQVTPQLKLAHYFSTRIVTSAEASYRYKRDKVEVLGQGIDTGLFTPDGAMHDDSPLLLSVGRLSPIKDPMTMVRAVHLLHQRGYNTVRMALVGGPPEHDQSYADKVRHLVRELHLEECAQFVGALPFEKVAGWHRLAFAHVNASPTDHSIDKAALEAMACGKPSLSSTEAFRETMGIHADTLLFRQGDADDLAVKIEALIKMPPAELHDMGCYLRGRIVQMHSLDHLSEKLASLFLKLT
ncbi:MAG: glycosyltransferase family 4 protein [Armatimonadetes bacterium]|nr:glycosyltransferase family 4 protein [Armatimonadota bacterium]